MYIPSPCLPPSSIPCTIISPMCTSLHTPHIFCYSTVFPGNYGFRVTFNSTSAAYSYCESSKVLYVNRGVDFAAIFSFTTPPSPGFNVRTLVCPKNVEDFQKVGVVKTCAQHLHKDNSK